MTILLQAFLAALPRALLALFAKILTDRFAAKIVEDVFVWCAVTLARNTKSNLDDRAVAIIMEQLNRNPDGTPKE